MSRASSVCPRIMDVQYRSTLLRLAQSNRNMSCHTDARPMTKESCGCGRRILKSSVAIKIFEKNIAHTWKALNRRAGPIPAFAWSDCGKTMKTRNQDGRTGDRTRCLPNASPISYHFATSFGTCDQRPQIKLRLYVYPFLDWLRKALRTSLVCLIGYCMLRMFPHSLACWLANRLQGVDWRTAFQHSCWLVVPNLVESRRETMAALNNEVLRAERNPPTSALESSGTIATHERYENTYLRIENGSPWWEANRATIAATKPSRARNKLKHNRVVRFFLQMGTLAWNGVSVSNVVVKGLGVSETGEYSELYSRVETVHWCRQLRPLSHPNIFAMYNTILEHSKIAKNGVFKALYLKIFGLDTYISTRMARSEPFHRLSSSNMQGRRLKFHRYTHHDENTARNVRAWRVAAMAHFIRGSNLRSGKVSGETPRMPVPGDVTLNKILESRMQIRVRYASSRTSTYLGVAQGMPSWREREYLEKTWARGLRDPHAAETSPHVRGSTERWRAHGVFAVGWPSFAATSVALPESSPNIDSIFIPHPYTVLPFPACQGAHQLSPTPCGAPGSSLLTQHVHIGTKIDESEIQNHEISLVQHFYIGAKIKLDPDSELGSFDLGSGKMLAQPGIKDSVIPRMGAGKESAMVRSKRSSQHTPGVISGNHGGRNHNGRTGVYHCASPLGFSTRVAQLRVVSYCGIGQCTNDARSSNGIVNYYLMPWMLGIETATSHYARKKYQPAYTFLVDCLCLGIALLRQPSARRLATSLCTRCWDRRRRAVTALPVATPHVHDVLLRREYVADIWLRSKSSIVPRYCSWSVSGRPVLRPGSIPGGKLSYDGYEECSGNCCRGFLGALSVFLFRLHSIASSTPLGRDYDDVTHRNSALNATAYLSPSCLNSFILRAGRSNICDRSVPLIRQQVRSSASLLSSIRDPASGGNHVGFSFLVALWLIKDLAYGQGLVKAYFKAYGVRWAVKFYIDDENLVRGPHSEDSFNREGGAGPCHRTMSGPEGRRGDMTRGPARSGAGGHPAGNRTWRKQWIASIARRHFPKKRQVASTELAGMVQLPEVLLVKFADEAVGRMEQRRNAREGETGVPRENPPASDIVRHDSHLRKSGRMTRPEFEHASPWWEASNLTAQPPWPYPAFRNGARTTIAFAWSDLGKPLRNRNQDGLTGIRTQDLQNVRKKVYHCASADDKSSQHSLNHEPGVVKWSLRCGRWRSVQAATLRHFFELLRTDSPEQNTLYRKLESRATSKPHSGMLDSSLIKCFLLELCTPLGGLPMKRGITVFVIEIRVVLTTGLQIFPVQLFFILNKATEDPKTNDRCCRKNFFCPLGKCDRRLRQAIGSDLKRAYWLVQCLVGYTLQSSGEAIRDGKHVERGEVSSSSAEGAGAPAVNGVVSRRRDTALPTTARRRRQRVLRRGNTRGTARRAHPRGRVASAATPGPLSTRAPHYHVAAAPTTPTSLRSCETPGRPISITTGGHRAPGHRRPSSSAALRFVEPTSRDHEHRYREVVRHGAATGGRTWSSSRPRLWSNRA
ncbi:hypothetical protein PR048_006074 [Dryococelus australis]|uniref:Uncharacterized protein n=1 Tax=Dryococelus australis TaxID=614101 RepID=A0ABQ9IA11_9NEOP|nr:hypothetical protein PR048_006074 [Dryococelus australis]